MRAFVILIWACGWIQPVFGQAGRIAIPFTSSYITIDGKSNDWNALDIEIPGGGEIPYRNINRAALCWNESYLFAIFKIGDQQLIAHESGNNNVRLYFNDGVELYLDTQGDSDAAMDKNDYQFLIALPDASVVFRGDKFLLQQGHKVPKDYENHTVIFEKAVSISGTVNEPDDVDYGYIMEIAIPWQTLGLSPEEGMVMKMDLCVNDLDTLADMAAMPEDWHPASMNYINLQGKSDYGYPQYWSSCILTGSPGVVSVLRKKLEQRWQYYYSLIAMLLIMGSWVIYKQFKKIRFYQNFPTRPDAWERGVSERSHIAVNADFVADPGALKQEIPESIQLLKKYIQDHISEEINLQDLCRHIYLGSRQLQRLTREHCDMSPMQLVNVYKMEAAAQRLTSTSLTISEIAFDLGYENAAYFSQLFKKYFGQSPVLYRKNNS